MNKPATNRAVKVHDKEMNVSIANAAHETFWNRAEAGNWEPETLNLMEKFLSPGSLFIDIGAWIGPTTLFASSLGSDVEAFEPHPENYAHLENNVTTAGFQDQVNTHNYGVWENTGSYELHSSPGKTSGASLVPHSSDMESHTIAMRSLYDISELKSDGISLIKMDIEGAKYNLLSKFIDQLPTPKPPILLSIHPHKVDRDKNAFIRAIFGFYRTIQLWSGIKKYKNTYKVIDNNGSLLLKGWGMNDYFTHCFSGLLINRFRSWFNYNSVLLIDTEVNENN